VIISLGRKTHTQTCPSYEESKREKNKHHMLRKHHCTPPILNRIQKTPSTLLDNPTHFQNPKETPGRRTGNPTSKPYEEKRGPREDLLYPSPQNRKSGTPELCSNLPLENPFRQPRRIPLDLPHKADAYATTTKRFRFSAKPPATTP